MKFAITERAFIRKYGAVAASSKLTYTFHSNRPIAVEMAEAFGTASIAQAAATREVVDQLDQLRKSIKWGDERWNSFVARIALVGTQEKLQAVERANARTIADWSASNDALARARIGDLRKVVRDKAGAEGEGNKLIKRADVLYALELADEDSLLPTPQAFPDVGDVVKRVQLSDFLNSLSLSQRWIVHAAGGVGKTVFVQTAASELARENEVVLFDCFGGGAYRTATDARHKPERGLLHIVNELACRGLCDPILPGTNDSAEVVRRSLDRFRHTIEVIRRRKPGTRLFIIIDAADNAALEAKHRSQSSFPRELLESLTTAERTIDGLYVICTARSERIQNARRHSARRGRFRWDRCVPRCQRQDDGSSARTFSQWRSDAYSYRVATRAADICAVSQALGATNGVGYLDKATRCRSLPVPIAAAILKSVTVDDATAAKLLSAVARAVTRTRRSGDGFRGVRRNGLVQSRFAALCPARSTAETGSARTQPGRASRSASRESLEPSGCLLDTRSRPLALIRRRPNFRGESAPHALRLPSSRALGLSRSGRCT